MSPAQSPRPILIAGPTASGKSALALALAERFDGAVINADALQVYAGWRALSARPSPADEARAPHLLYGHVAMRDGYSAGRWLRDAAQALADCAAAGRRAIVVGGTGLYFRALTEGLADIPETPPDIRAAAVAFLETHGIDGLAADLENRDPATLARIDARNPMRLMRAWEALETAGEGLAALQDRTPPPLLAPDGTCALRLAPDRDRLYARCDARFDAMLAQGALEEVRAALALDPPASAQAMKAIGARELAACLAGEMTLEAARAQAVTLTRNYAKRQMTWLRNRMGDWPAYGSAAAALDAADL